jgi:thiol-disulfide isomerase/thioredoxin
MGKQARLKRERNRVPPPPVGERRSTQRWIWVATAALGAVIAVVAIVLATRSSSNEPPPPVAAGASDEKASPELVQAADAVGFAPSTEPGVGEMEGKPAAEASPPRSTALLGKGTTAPSFSLKTPTGETVQLSDSRGKAVLVEFFATWCPHCQAEAPHLKALAQALDKKKYAFVSINADSEDAASVYAFERYFGLPYPALLDPGSPPGSFHRQGGTGPVTQSYGLQAYPTFYVIDPDGKVFWASDGEQPDALIRAKLQAAAGAG